MLKWRDNHFCQFRNHFLDSYVAINHNITIKGHGDGTTISEQEMALIQEAF